MKREPVLRILLLYDNKLTLRLNSSSTFTGLVELLHHRERPDRFPTAWHGLAREYYCPRLQGPPAGGEDGSVHPWDRASSPPGHPLKTVHAASSRTQHTPATSCYLPYCWADVIRAWGLILTGSETVSVYKLLDCWTLELYWPPPLTLHTLAHMPSLTHPHTHTDIRTYTFMLHTHHNSYYQTFS